MTNQTEHQTKIDTTRVNLRLLLTQRLAVCDLVANGDLVAVSVSQRKALGRLDDFLGLIGTINCSDTIGINFKQIRADKFMLLETLGGARLSDDQRDSLDGVLSLLDNVQDQAESQYGELAVFGKPNSV